VATGWPAFHRSRLSDTRVWLVAEKEVAENIRNFKAPAAFLLLLGLIMTSSFLMSLDYQKRLENWSANRDAQSDKLFSGITSNYRSFDNLMSMSARSIGPEPLLRKPLALSIFAKGLDSVMERAVNIGDHPTVGPAIGIKFGTPQEQNRSINMFAPPDFLYIVKIILALLALFFTYDALVGEKEMGTLKVMLSCSTERRTILLGKWIGATLSLSLPFVMAAMFGLIYLTAVRDFAFERVEWARIGLVIIASVLYGMVFISLGLMLSAWASTRKQAIAVSLSAWVVLVMVIPNVTPLVARWVKPLPTLVEHNAALVPLARQLEDEAKATSGEEGVPYAGYGTHYPSAAPRLRQMAKQADDAYIARKLERDRFARFLARLSPAGTISYSVTDLTGTGLSEFQSYMSRLQQARDRQIELAEAKETAVSLNIANQAEQSAADAKLKEFFERGKQLQKELYQSLLIARSPAEAINDALPDLGALAIWSAVMLALAALTFNRADVR
jgi:ABC-type transport system involved in multi-copper enzyme maturation permease subunit